MNYSTHPGSGRFVPVLSASSAQLWQRCRRAWGHRYLDGLRPPEDPWRRRGTLVHEVLKERLSGRPDPARPEDVDAKRWREVLDLAQRVGSLLPGPRSGLILAVERPVLLHTEHAEWRGQLDLAFREGPAAGGEIVVSDHKTTRDRERAKTPEELARDAQAAVYGSWAIAEWDLAEVALQWTYATTRGRRAAFPVRARVSRERAAGELARLDAEVAAPIARALATGAPSTDLEQNWRACDDFGGCPHRALCGERPLLLALEQYVSDEATGSDPTQQQTLWESLGGAPDAVPPGPYPAVNRPPPPGAPAEYAELYQAAQPPGATHPVPEYAPAGAAPPPVPAPSTSSTPQSLEPGPERAGEGGALLWGASQTQPALAPTPPSAAQLVTQASHHPNEQQAPGRVQAQQSPAPAVPAVPPQPAYQPPQPTPTPEPARQPQPEYRVQATPGEGGGFALLVASFFVGATPPGRVVQAEALIAEARRRVAAAAGVPDYRMIKYGEGQGQLAYHVAGVLSEARLGPGDTVIVSSPGSAEWTHVGQVFVERAGLHVRGIGA